MVDKLSIAVYTFLMRLLTLLSVDAIIQPRYVNRSINFRGFPFNVEITPFGLNNMNSILSRFTYKTEYIYIYIYITKLNSYSLIALALYIYIYTYIYIYNWLIGLVGRVFANCPGVQGSISGHVIPNTLKMILDTFLLNT